MTSVSSFLVETTDLLGRTPQVLGALLRGLSDDWTDTPDVAGGWRPRDVVGHLITGEQAEWLKRVRRILEQGTAVPFEPYDQFAMLERDIGIPLDDLLEQFASMRAANLLALGDLVTESDLDRRGLHPTLGEVTLAQLLGSWTVHDLDHVSQVYAGLAGSRDADVGPWRANLGILLRREDRAAIAG